MNGLFISLDLDEDVSTLLASCFGPRDLMR